MQNIRDGLIAADPAGRDVYEANAKKFLAEIDAVEKTVKDGIAIENITDHRLLDQIARETGAKISGTLFSDALSDANGPAATYLDMFRHNIRTLTAALAS